MSQAYLEGHVSAYINSLLVADIDTKEALKCAEEREGQWTRKSSTLMQCKQILKEMTEEDGCTIPTVGNVYKESKTLSKVADCLNNIEMLLKNNKPEV